MTYWQRGWRTSLAGFPTVQRPGSPPPLFAKCRAKRGRRRAADSLGSVVRYFINGNFTADALVGVNVDVRALLSRFYPDQSHRLATSGTPGPVKSIRVG
jgi:hypothetical protein